MAGLALALGFLFKYTIVLLAIAEIAVLALSLVAGAILAGLVYYFELEAELYILGFGLMVYGVVQVVTALMIRQGAAKRASFSQYLGDS